MGGGSLVYANVQLRAPAEVFERGLAGGDRPRTSSTRGTTRTEEALRAADDAGEPALPKVRAFAAAGRRAGRQAELLPIAVHFGETREHPFSGVAPGGLPEPRPLRHRLPGARQEHGRHHLRRARRGARRRGLPASTWRRGLAPPAPARRQLARRLPRPRRAATGGTVEAPTLVLAAGTLGSTPRCCCTTASGCRACRPRSAPASRATATRWRSRSTRRRADVRGARTRFGPVMTSSSTTRPTRAADRRRRRAAARLRASLLDVARGVNVIRGWRRWLLRVRDALVQRRAERPGDAPARAAPARSARGERRLADLPDDRPRRRRRPDAADAAVPPASTSAGARRAARALFADLERTANELADGGGGDAVLRARGRPAGHVHDRAPARRLPDGRRPGARGRRRPRPRLRRTRACTCSTARSCRPRSASTRRRRSPRWPSAARARLVEELG